MDILTRRAIEKRNTDLKFNPLSMKNFSTTLVPQVPEFIDRLIQSIISNSTDKLEYKGYKILNPEEVYDAVYRRNIGGIPSIKKNATKIPFDIASSSLYTLRLYFAYNGEDLVIDERKFKDVK